MDRKKLYPWYFTSGALIIFFLLCFLPGIIGILYSFTDWNNFTDKINFVGFKNYIEVFQRKTRISYVYMEYSCVYNNYNNYEDCSRI